MTHTTNYKNTKERHKAKECLEECVYCKQEKDAQIEQRFIQSENYKKWCAATPKHLRKKAKIIQNT